MASRRNLKKSINNICSDLLFVCAVVANDKPEAKEQLLPLAQEVLSLNAEFVTRISHTEPGSVRLFYSKLRQEFSEKVQNLYGQLTQI